jgi:thiamine-monophosphate kinase
MLSESKIIADLKSSFPEYIGDDAAVLELQSDKRTLISKDILVEDIHFRTSYCDAKSLAHKALHVNLSDLAAMGGTPEFVLLGIAFPTMHQGYVQNFLESFALACQDARVVLIGGDTTRSPDKLFLSITVTGSASAKNVKYRHDAKPRDLICVAGDLGHAHLGLIACERSLSGFDDYKRAFLRPIAKVGEGSWLAKQPGVHAMMDISDGLYIDLKRLCAASKVQGRLELERLQQTKKFTAASVELDVKDAALVGGEDYGLLFTVSPKHYEALFEGFVRQFEYEVKRVGVITNGRGLSLTQNGLVKAMSSKPFAHFEV